MYHTQKFQRTIHQPATLVGGIGAIVFAVAPPIGVIMLVIAFLMQRNFTKQRRGFGTVAQRRAAERQEQVRILALKSLR